MNKHFNHNLIHFIPKSKPIKEDLIFISIASYRDPLCIKTIKSIFKQSKEPDKIRIGLCIQNDINDYIGNINKKYFSYIKIIKIPHYLAKGPTWARFLCNTLWKGEEYFLQIDSHTVFDKHWDVNIKDMYNSLPPKSIITYYPPKMDTKNTNSITVHSHDCYVNEKQQIIAISKIVPKTEKPVISRFASCNFFFVHSQFIIDVPWDPYLPFLFQGEEPLIGMRALSNGWTMYHPTFAVCKHYYTRDKEPKFWNDLNKEYLKFNPLSSKRTRYFLGIDKYNPNNNKNIYLHQHLFHVLQNIF